MEYILVANILKVKRSSVQGKIPLTTDIDLGELAVNTYDGKLFLKKNVGGTETIVDVTVGADAGTVLNLLKTVDGSGSGLDADLVEGMHAVSTNTVNSIVARDASGNFSAGTITAALSGNASTTTKLATARTISITGDVTGSVSFDGSADASITATIAANSVALGTDTTGNYVASVATTAPLSGGAVGSEGGALTLSLASGYGDTQNPYASKTANTVLAAPNGSAGVPSFRALVAQDIPALDASKITSGVLDAARLPSYVDDVLEYTNLASFPTTGETGKIYVDLATNKTYRWSGTVYVYITSGAVDSVAGKTGVVTLTNSDVGLGNVENKSSATIRGELTSANVTTALGFTPYNATNPNGYTANTGTVTSVSGTGTASGLTLSGTVTSSGSLTLSGTVNALAAGTYGISITGNAATASNCNSASGQWYGAAINSSVASGTDTSSLQVRNVSGATGDGGVAAMSFHCQGTYAIKMHLRADGYFGLGGWSRAAWSWYSDPSGNMVAAGNVTAYSDPRLKENFAKVENPLEILSKLDGGTFNWKRGYSHTECKAGSRDYGILADQVELVMPEIVTESIEIDGEKYKTVAYEKLIPVLIEAIKELKAEIDLLKSVK